MDIVNAVLEIVLRVLCFGLGVYIVGQTMWQATQTVVLPRSANVWLTRQVFLRVRDLFRFRTRRARSYEDRDRVMAMYAPVSLLVLVVTWLVCTAAGFMLLYRALGMPTWVEAFTLSGSSLLTLGIMQPQGFVMTWFVFAEATFGLIIVAMLISYLPTIYSVFSRREELVSALEIRAGTPPSGVELLTRAHTWGWANQLPDLWAQWELWFLDLGETHTSFGMLAFFRSPRPEHSWVTAAGAVLDAAALMWAVVDDPQARKSGACLRAGFRALHLLADFYRISYDANPKPDDPIAIQRDEFDAACDDLAAAGVPLKADREQAWRDFAGWRVNYDTALLAIAAMVMAPYAQWSSDRSFLQYQRPTKLRWTPWAQTTRETPLLRG